MAGMGTWTRVVGNNLRFLHRPGTGRTSGLLQGGEASAVTSAPSVRHYIDQNFLYSRSAENLDKCDVCIIGGGVMGLSTAYWIKSHTAGKDLRVVVVERDPKYTKASSPLSMGGIRQQFSLKENIELSLFSSEFLRNADKYLGVVDKDKQLRTADIQYHPVGYLFLTGTQEGAELLEQNWSLQSKLGAKVDLLSKAKLKEKFPFFNVDDVELGCFGRDNEGYFDPWSFLAAFKRKCLDLGVEYVHGDVSGFEYKTSPGQPVLGPNCVKIDISSNPEGDGVGEDLVVVNKKKQTRNLEFTHCVVAAGYEAGAVSRLAGIGEGKGWLATAVPVEPRKRYVYFVHSPSAPDKGFPMLIDSSGAYARREGAPGHFLCGISPSEGEEPTTADLEVDYSFFDNNVWPRLAHRVPAFEDLKVKSAWAGYYDYNYFDHNGIIGTHPAFKNFHFATGFSGHGIQQSPAVGLALMELVIYGRTQTFDLQRFGFERLIEGSKVLEQNIV